MKKILLFLIAVSICSFTLYAQEEDSSYEDDFDSLFDDAEDLDEPVITEEDNTKNNVTSPFSSNIKLSGNFNGNVGLSCFYDNGQFDAGGALTFANTVNMDVSPNDYFKLHSSFYTGLDNGFTFALSSCYFDYYLLNSIFISAGKKGINWGYPRLFNDSSIYNSSSSFGPQYCNVVSDYGSNIICQVRIPWSTGTFTLIPMCSTDNISENKVSYKSFNYAFSLENTIGNTCTNLYGRICEVSQDAFKSILGVELKRTILGFDCYAQGNTYITDFTSLNSADSYEYVTGTAGFYRLWDKSEPHLGINAEYQLAWNEKADNDFTHRIVIEGGIKRLGKNKNHKIGAVWRHNFTDEEGRVELVYLISGLFPYANWTNGCQIAYNQNKDINILFATTISLDIDY